MLSNKDYTKMTLEELVSEEKKIKSQKTMTAVFIGVLIGIAVWSATHKGGFLTFLLLFFAMLIGYRATQNLKNIQAEISRRNTVG
jgi:uncharacterized membrane protein YbjE (DUF340 family)